MKTIFDIVCAFFGLIFFAPFVLIISLLILLVDQMPPLFTQKRLGLKKKPFHIIKFRTMKNDKITGLGGILRRTGLDEIPQLFNVLILEMSIVGPRPLTEEDVDRLEWNSEYYNKRWKLKPGIVGLAQLSPVCHKKMSWMFDRSYIQHQTFGLDMKIIFSTLAVPFVGKEKVKKWIYSRD